MPENNDSPATIKQREILAFLGLTGVVAPALAIAVVAAYGFAVWFYQLFVGPPTG
jgi:periplasmic nitrate reductase NapE